MVVESEEIRNCSRCTDDPDFVQPDEQCDSECDVSDSEFFVNEVSSLNRR